MIRRWLWGAVWALALQLAFQVPASSQGSTQQSGKAPVAPQPDSQFAASSVSSGSGQIDEAQLVGLPLNGRNYSQLATLPSGVSDTFGGGK